MKLAKLTLLSFALLISGLSFAQTTWKLDNAHSNIKFTVTYLVVSEIDGNFKTFDGSITSSKEDLSDANINFSVDVASINTDNSMRDQHLLADDFFAAATYPKMTFKSTSFKKKAGDKYELSGDMTIRNVTKKVVFDVKYGGTVKDSYGNTRAGFKVQGKINRIEYGISWNSKNEAGNDVVGKDVQFNLNLQFIKSK
ncbi:MAG: polyisoprenoid-binding protein [Ferruginibacter sp.]|nr:polyisoprenoid-binding protein [Ferruginibacter sp.]